MTTPRKKRALTIVVTSADVAETPAVRALQQAGHTVTVHVIPADLILGPQCYTVLPEFTTHLPLVLRSLQQRRRESHDLQTELPRTTPETDR